MKHEITKEYLQQFQYGTTKYLEARIRLHRQFGNGQTIHSWAGAIIPFTGLHRVLDVGCGTGEFWKENTTRLASGSHLVLADFSAAMIEKASATVAFPAARFEVADVESLPFQDGSFDLVMAHHMLYHASDLIKAITEIKRVLANAGCVTITTNSCSHMRELYELGQELDSQFPADRIIDAFTEEIADHFLPQHFSSIEKHILAEDLLIDDLEPLLDYVASGIVPRAVPVASDFFERFSDRINLEIKRNGHFFLQKRSSLYILRK
jgi:ubiquinone/menaquinone biosynthesis C-methylase UbiE